MVQLENYNKFIWLFCLINYKWIKLILSNKHNLLTKEFLKIVSLCPIISRRKEVTCVWRQTASASGWFQQQKGLDKLLKKLTDSSSFSIPVGICGTALLWPVYSCFPEISSFLYTGSGLLASRALARNESLLIVVVVESKIFLMFHFKISLRNNHNLMKI